MGCPSGFSGPVSRFRVLGQDGNNPAHRRLRLWDDKAVTDCLFYRVDAMQDGGVVSAEASADEWQRFAAEPIDKPHGHLADVYDRDLPAGAKQVFHFDAGHERHKLYEFSGFERAAFIGAAEYGGLYLECE
jgi:hypothetical protein